MASMRSADGFLFDERQAPLHLEVWPATFSHASLDQHLTAIEHYFTRLAQERSDRHVALIADVRSEPWLDARHRQRVAQTFERMTPIMEKRAVAHAVITSSSMVRGALTAILWIKTPPWPLRVFASMEEGSAWLVRSFEERGLECARPAQGWWGRQ